MGNRQGTERRKPLTRVQEASRGSRLGFPCCCLDWEQETRVILLGLPNSGKTSILYKLKLGGVAATIPTRGFNVENIEFKHLNPTLWDLGGSHPHLWVDLYEGTRGVIFVVDGSDPESLEESKERLVDALGHKDLADVVVLIFVNKQDVEGSLSVEEVTVSLGLTEGTPLRQRARVTGCSAYSGEGLTSGLDWLLRQLL